MEIIIALAIISVISGFITWLVIFKDEL